MGVPGSSPDRTPEEGFTTPTERGDRRWHRALAVSLFVVAVLHLVILISVQSTPQPRSPFSAAGPDRGDYRAAAGGGAHG